MKYKNKYVGFGETKRNFFTMSKFNPMVRIGCENHGWSSNERPLLEFLESISHDENGNIKCDPKNIQKHINNVFHYGNTSGVINNNGNPAGIWFIETTDKPAGWSDNDKNSVDAF